jgi:hypothetical protein
MSAVHRRRFAGNKILAAEILAFSGALVAAQTAQAGDGDVVTLLIENDIIAGTDQHYTNGLEISYLSVQDGVPGSLRPGVAILPGVAREDVMRFGVSLGQQIYTPNNIDATEPLPDERPYAGWLYLGFALVADHGTQLDTWVLNLGMVGPSARGEEVQNGFHEAISGAHANGWDNQLHDEFGGALIYEHRWRNIYAKKFDGFGLDISPHLGFSLGNVATYANGGLTLRLGNAVHTDFGVPRIRPSLPGSAFFDPTTGGFSWYVFAGADFRYVARNIFLDGNSDGDSLSVEKEEFVGELQSGFAMVWRRIRFAYTYVLRTKEYEGQLEPDKFASVGISYRF